MDNLSDALKTAISMEKKGYDLYMGASKRTANNLGKLTLEAIAVKELDHIKAIEELAEKMSEGILDINKAIDDIKPMDKKDYVQPIMDKLGSELKGTIKTDSDLEKAYKVAMGLEKASYDMYKKLAGEAKNSQIKRFFELLMKEEDLHYEILQETLEYLNRPGDWFKEQERWIVEG